MRNFVISAISLLIIVVIWGYFYFYASEKIEIYEASIETIINSYIYNEKWDEAQSAFDKLHHDWNRFKRTASFFTDSSSLNHIDSTFKKIYYYIDAADISNSSGELAYLKGLFTALQGSEALNLKNVF